MSQFDDERTMPVTNAAKTHTKKLAAKPFRNSMHAKYRNWIAMVAPGAWQ